MFEPTITFGALLFYLERFILIGALYLQWAPKLYDVQKLYDVTLCQ